MSDFDFESSSSPLQDAAVSMHELYTTLKAAGFNRRDSLELIAKILTGAISDAISRGDDEEDE